MTINSTSEVIESATDLSSTMDSVDNESIKKSETKGYCQSVDKLSTDISENTITKTKDTESIEEVCKSISDLISKLTEIPTEADPKEFFGSASSRKNEYSIESLDDS